MRRRCKVAQIVVVSVIVLCVGQVALAQVEWTYKAPAVGPGDPGSWNEGRNQLGDVVFDGTTYHMYLIGGPGENPLDNSWSVGHWTWNDALETWVPDPCNPVLEPGAARAWDSFTIGSLAVLYDGAMFKLWYGAAASLHGFGYAGYASNTDGWCDWEKHAGNPLAGLDPGLPGAWDENGSLPSSVLFDGDVYQMWDTSSSGDIWWGTWAIGYATSTDGLSWTRHPDPVLEATEPWEEDKVYSPEVVRIDENFVMWYSGLNMSAPGSSMGYAVSPDGIHWAKWPGNPVLTPTPPCAALDTCSMMIKGDMIHGWVRHCDDVTFVTSPLELVYFDSFETGDTSLWTVVVP